MFRNSVAINLRIIDRITTRTKKTVAVYLVALLLFIYFPYRASAQDPQAEHLSHHPELAAQATAGTSAPNQPMSAGAPGVNVGQPAAAGPAGMMAGMGEMMKKMSLPPKKDFYPSLVEIPNLSPERWNEIQQIAHARMIEGLGQLSQGLGALSAAVDQDNFSQMQQALAEMRQGIRLVDSGLSAHRLLAEGESPHNIALSWFKSGMNLSDEATLHSGIFWGVSFFHLMVMALLSVFSATMILMYFFKMRRAAALFGRIEPDANSIPPGSLPPADKGGGSAPPLTSKWRGQLEIESIVPETPYINTFRLRSPGGGPLPFTFLPGQFLNVALSIGGARMNRSYSISSSPNERNYVDLSVKREDRGAFSRHIVDLWKTGTAVEAGGPVGKMTFTGAEAESVVLISAGIGITPMMSVARYLTENSWPGDIYFIFTCRNPTDFLFKKALELLTTKNQKLHLVVAMTKPGPDWKGPRGHITKELLEQNVPGIAAKRIHLCGPPRMMEETKVVLGQLGAALDQVKTEAFGAVKPPLAGANDPVKPKTEATGPEVTFSNNHKTAKIYIEQTILELSEELAIGIENSCRVGTCGICKVKMTSGEVDMEVEDALDAEDKANNIILACQAKPKTAVTIEA